MKVGAVVLHYRFWPGVRSTLEGLLEQTRPPDSLLVVDNHSEDGSVPRLRQAFPNLEVIVAPENRGYAAGMNLGMETLLGRGVDALFLLTHECRLEPGALEALVIRLQEEPTLGAVGPILGYLSKPDLVFSAGGVIEHRRWRPRHVRTPKLLAEWVGKPAQSVEWLDGAALLLRSTAVRTVGKFDEAYFLFFEETEYLLRLREMGWMVECVPSARAWQEPSTYPTYLWVRNRLRFIARTAPRRLLLGELARVLRDLLRESPRPGSMDSDNRDRVKALLHFFAGRWGAPAVADGHDSRARTTSPLKNRPGRGRPNPGAGSRPREAGPGSDQPG